MKKIINYIALLISIVCLPVGYVVACGNSVVAGEFMHEKQLRSSVSCISFSNPLKIPVQTISDLNSAQNLSNKLNQPVIATDGYVCIYSDGGLSVIPRDGNGSTKWYLLKPNAVRIEAASPRAPGSSTLDYVQMGGSKVSTVLSTYIQSLIDKDIRTAIIDTKESRFISKTYWEVYKSQNPSPLTGKYLNDSIAWYNEVFKTPDFQAHHIIPKNVLESLPELQQLLENNKTGQFDFGGITNGIMLSTRAGGDGDHANHPNYDRQVKAKIQEIIADAPNDSIALTVVCGTQNTRGRLN